MEFAFVVYAISVIGKLGYLLFVLTFLAFMVLLAHCIYVGESYQKTFKDDFRMKFLVIPVVLSCLLTFTPSERTMYLMAGAYASQAVIQSDLAKDVVSILELKVKEQLKELQTKSKE